MLEELMTQAFWVGLAKIIGVNVILSGDNAVVIALAARSLPRKQQKQAIIWGSAAAIVLRVVLTLFAVALLTLPWLKIVGSLLLFWIGVKLLIPEEGDARHQGERPAAGRDQDHPHRRPRDEPRQRDRGGRGRRRQRGAADPGPCDLASRWSSSAPRCSSS